MPDDPTARVPADPSALDIRAKVYLWLTAVFVTALLLANIVGVKVFAIPMRLPLVGEFTVEHTIGMLPFPITFLLTDLLNEYYGKRGARRVAYIGFAMGGLTFLLIQLSRKFPTLEGIPGTATDAAYENIFGAATLMYVCSLAAFLLSSLLDIFLFGVFKRLTRGRMVWLRATGSTIISQLFDSILISYFFFWLAPILLRMIDPGHPPPADVAWVTRTALTGYILKFVIAVAVTPLIYFGRWFIRTRFGMQPVPVER
jgi:uncharacterized integral membrane protein (TIGR00697 family)